MAADYYWAGTISGANANGNWVDGSAVPIVGTPTAGVDTIYFLDSPTNPFADTLIAGFAGSVNINVAAAALDAAASFLGSVAVSGDGDLIGHFTDVVQSAVGRIDYHAAVITNSISLDNGATVFEIYSNNTDPGVSKVQRQADGGPASYKIHGIVMVPTLNTSALATTTASERNRNR